MSTSIDDAWAPEPELREPPPRRSRPSEYPDLNAPNVTLFRVGGGLLLLAGVSLLVLGGSQNRDLFTIGGVVAVLLSVLALILPARKAAQARARAERLVQDGQPVMARIVNATNLTGDSVHGRTVSYMITLPGGDSIRRDVNADERALPKRIPGNVTALIDPNNTRDVELYCALPLRAVAPERPASPAQTDLPLDNNASTSGQMGVVGDDTPPEPSQSQSQQQKQGASGCQGLPWE